MIDGKFVWNEIGLLDDEDVDFIEIQWTEASPVKIWFIYADPYYYFKIRNAANGLFRILSD